MFVAPWPTIMHPQRLALPSLKDKWLRLRDSRVLVVRGWERRGDKLHSPTLFLWGRALQSNPRHWPDSCGLVSGYLRGDRGVAKDAVPKRATSSLCAVIWGRVNARAGRKQVNGVCPRHGAQGLDARGGCTRPCVVGLKCVAPEGQAFGVGHVSWGHVRPSGVHRLGSGHVGGMS